MDPHAVLGIAPEASGDEVAAAYRRLAKRFHPDHAGEAAAARMAEINAAYARLRDPSGLRPAVPPPGPKRRTTGDWLPRAPRRTLGPELLQVLHDGEPVEAVTRAATWSSPDTLLVVTDRRLIWLQNDVVVGRVRSLRFDRVAEVEAPRLSWPRRRLAVLRLKVRGGRRVSFAELEPRVAQDLVVRLRAAVAA